MKSKSRLFPEVLGYRLFRAFGHPKMMPINVTVSITNMCNSRCKTCYIWNRYETNPEKKRDELTADEFEKIFQSLGKQVFWTTISGGEPSLRTDLPRICEALCDFCEPALINIPSNGLLPATLKDRTREILQRCPETTVIVNLSLDGVGFEHDNIRGVKGSFERFAESYSRLKSLREEFSNLQIGVHSVISRFNINRMSFLYDLAEKLDPDSYITEVAERRTELFNIGKNITPESEEYASVIEELSDRIRNGYLHSDRALSRLTQAFRLTYYQIAIQELREQRQIIPCYAGYASCQITPYGDVWPCCILGYDRPMGNLRDMNYDFRQVWFSKKADEARTYIKSRNCACPLANAHYTSILCNFHSMFGVLKNAL